jgi:hypothetical protein
MTPKKAIILGCGIAALVLVAGVAAVILFFVYASQDVKGMALAVDGPTDVLVGQTFKLEVTVTNERPRKVLRLSDVDIAEGYLAGFSVVSVSPSPKSNKHVPIDNSRSFTFDVQIPTRTSRSFTFTLRAEKAGLYRGDVDVCEGARFTTGMAQTSVKDKE